MGCQGENYPTERTRCRELLGNKGNRTEVCPMPGAVPRRMTHACDIHAVLDPTPVVS